MKALLVVVIALLLLVGAITGALALGSRSSATVSGKGPIQALGDPVLGRQVAMRPQINCFFCHSEDGSPQIGPSFKGLWGSVVKYDDGSSGLIDDAAVRIVLKDPNGKIVDGYEPRMPELDSKMSEQDKLNLLAYLRSIGAGK